MPLEQRVRASALCLAEGHLLLVRLRDPVTGVEALYPPGGAIEPGETPEEAARRETLEETGLAVRIEPSVRLVDTYPFTWGDAHRLITTHYYGASLEGPFNPVVPPVKDADYNLGASWVPVAEALELLAVNPVIGAACARVVRLAQIAAWKKDPSF
jgi:8-oxo-dGTP pyrophosphatase MutT (NUDIX family)